MNRPARHPVFDTPPIRGNGAEPGGADEARQRWRPVFVDGRLLDITTPSPGMSSSGMSYAQEDAVPAEAPLRVVTRLDDEVAGVRKNVQDAARAVVAWLSAMVGHEGKTNLNATLDRCLRPGPDIERVNYAAMATDIFRVTGVELTAKRVQTAVTHLRAARQKTADAAAAKAVAQAAAPASDVLRRALEQLDTRLRENYGELIAGGSRDQGAVRREMGTEVLTAVRSAAGRVIDRDFGEGIPATVNLAALEDRFLRFVRDTLQRGAFQGPQKTVSDTVSPVITSAGKNGRGPVNPASVGVEADLRRLLITLADHDATAEADMKLVMHGSRVVASLLGVDSLPGVMAQLNVLVSGRGLIDTDLYVAEMIRLGDLAESLHADLATKTYLNWVRRLPEDQRLPSPIRVSSYCRSNAATRLLDRLFAGDLNPDDPADADAGQPQRTYLQLATDTHDRMLDRDGGFTLTLTTHLLRHVVIAHLTGNKSDATAYLESLGPAKALDRLEALVRFDNNDDLVAAARKLVTSVYPELKRQLVCVR